MAFFKRAAQQPSQKPPAPAPSAPDRAGRGDLHHLALEGRLDEMRSGIQRGEDIDLADKAGFTPLHFAAQQKQLEAVRLLLAAGADPDLRNKHGNGPLWTAVFAASTADDGVVRLLLAAGADPDHENLAGETPRGLARKMGYELPLLSGRSTTAPPAAEPERPAAFDGETAQLLYDRMMKDVVSPALRELCFTGSGGRFELKRDSETWRSLGFQKSTYSDRDGVRFTLNLSTISKAVWQEQSATRALPAKPSPSTFYGSWARQARITSVLPNWTDSEKWWRIIPGQDLDAVSGDLLANIRDHALPWLQEGP